MQKSIELDGETALGGEYVDFCLRGGHLVVFPCQDAAREVCHAESFRGKLVGSIGRAAPTTAIDRHGTCFAKLGGCCSDEVVALDVNIGRAIDVPLGIFLGSSHIDELHVDIADELGEGVDIGINESLLAAC